MTDQAAVAPTEEAKKQKTCWDYFKHVLLCPCYTCVALVVLYPDKRKPGEVYTDSRGKTMVYGFDKLQQSDARASAMTNDALPPLTMSAPDRV
tara:strand:+ start:3915 stop:4193 length:279 start_codon:yes stop_codon:yes gene_type:complete